MDVGTSKRSISTEIINRPEELVVRYTVLTHCFSALNLVQSIKRYHSFRKILSSYSAMEKAYSVREKDGASAVYRQAQLKTTELKYVNDIAFRFITLLDRY